MTADFSAPSPAPHTANLPLTPARRLALMIGVPLALVLIAWTGFDIVAGIGSGSFRVLHTRIPVSGDTVHAHLSMADVTLRGGPAGSAATLDGTATYSLIRPDLTVSHDSGGARVDYRCVVPAGECGLNAVLTIPHGKNVAVSSDVGDLNIDGGIDGNVTVSSSAGDMTVHDLSRTVSLSTMVGDISADGLIATAVTAHTDAGDITLTFTGVPRNLHVSSATGDITIVLPHSAASYSIDANSSVGDVSEGGVPRSDSSPNKITATAAAGDITISEAP
jgi:hypothetical protein